MNLPISTEKLESYNDTLILKEIFMCRDTSTSKVRKFISRMYSKNKRCI